MDRRSFLKAGAVASLVPTVLFSRNPIPEINLQRFCDSDAYGRYDLSGPFAQLGWTYATDGRVAVRVDERPTIEPDDKRRVPDASVLCWAGDDSDGLWKPWPELRYEHWDCAVLCPQCEAKKRLGPGVRDCQECNGDGYVWEHFSDDFGDWEEPCKVCNKQGVIGGFECDRCQGKGSIPEAQVIGKSPMGPLYNRYVRARTGAETLEPINHRAWDASGYSLEAIRFRFVGGQGLLMPLSK